MSRAGEHTPLSPDKGETQSDERESDRKPAGDGDQQKRTHYCGHHQAGMAAGGTPGMQGDTPSKARLSEAPCTRSEYGSVDAVTVCLSCQHLYAGAAREVVLSPSHLEKDAFKSSPASPTSHKDFSMHRPWKVRRYEGLCDCGATASGGACVCPGRTTSGTLNGLLPNSSPCPRKVKIAALVLAALLPWAFLVAYIVLYYA